jgi:hypothetical protein
VRTFAHASEAASTRAPSSCGCATISWQAAAEFQSSASPIKIKVGVLMADEVIE